MPPGPYSFPRSRRCDVEVDGRMLRLGPTATAHVVTDGVGKLDLRVAASGLTVPTIQRDRQGIREGASVDVAAGVQGFLAGTSVLAAHPKLLRRRLLLDAKVSGRLAGAGIGTTRRPGRHAAGRPAGRRHSAPGVRPDAGDAVSRSGLVVLRGRRSDRSRPRAAARARRRATRWAPAHPSRRTAATSRGASATGARGGRFGITVSGRAVFTRRPPGGLTVELRPAERRRREHGSRGDLPVPRTPAWTGWWSGSPGLPLRGGLDDRGGAVSWRGGTAVRPDCRREPLPGAAEGRLVRGAPGAGHGSVRTLREQVDGLRIDSLQGINRLPCPASADLPARRRC